MEFIEISRNHHPGAIKVYEMTQRDLGEPRKPFIFLVFPCYSRLKQDILKTFELALFLSIWRPWKTFEGFPCKSSSYKLLEKIFRNK